MATLRPTVLSKKACWGKPVGVGVCVDEAVADCVSDGERVWLGVVVTVEDCVGVPDCVGDTVLEGVTDRVGLCVTVGERVCEGVDDVVSLAVSVWLRLPVWLGLCERLPVSDCVCDADTDGVGAALRELDGLPEPDGDDVPETLGLPDPVGVVLGAQAVWIAASRTARAGACVAHVPPLSAERRLP